jgi:hypothetical protein
MYMYNFIPLSPLSLNSCFTIIFPHAIIVSLNRDACPVHINMNIVHKYIGYVYKGIDSSIVKWIKLASVQLRGFCHGEFETLGIV